MNERRTLQCSLALCLGLAIGPAAGRAEVTVTETSDRLTVENESVRLVFASAVNYVPIELAFKGGSGENLIVDSFCLYYQFIEDGEIRSVNEGYPGGRISSGRHEVQKKDGAATLEFRGDTPHFRLLRRITVPATGPEVKFMYELDCKKADSFGFSLPYAPLSPRLNKSATHVQLVGKDGQKAGRILVEDVKTPRLHPDPPYTKTECFFDDRTGEGVIFAHIRGECAGGISERDKFRFDAGMQERCSFVLVPFQGNHEKVFTDYLDVKKDAEPDLSNASSAILLQKTPEWILWADHATRKIFPEEPLTPAAPRREEVSLEAARGEHEPFQIVLTPQEDLEDVRVVPAPWSDERGNRLEAENIQCHPIGSLRSSYGEEIPDLLLQKDGIACRKERNNVFWVTVKVPLATPAGIYRGALSLTSKGKKLADVRVSLKVRDFALAQTPHIRAFSTDYAYYYDSEVDLNDEAEAKAKARPTGGDAEEVAAYHTRMRFLADHRIYETHFGPRPNYSGALRVQWREDPNGRWDFAGIDFTAFDKAREYCYEELHWPRFAYDPELVPYLGFINQYTFGGKDEKEYWYMRYWDPVLPKKDAKKYLPSIYDLKDDFTPEFKEKFLRYIKTIAEHCREKRISIDEDGNGPVIFLADEIPAYSTNHAVVKKTLELARLIKEAEPRAVLVVNAPEVPDDPEIINLFDLWTARCSTEMLAKLRKMGKRYGDYYMHAYFDLRNPAISPRVQFWSYWKHDFFWIGSWAMTMTPDLRWYGSRRNYANSWWFPSMKSRYGEPMSTIRFELLREGLEDHEYLWMLRDRTAKLKATPEGGARGDLIAKAEALLRRAEEAGGDYKNTGGEYYFAGYLEEPIKLLDLRHDVAEMVESLGTAILAKRGEGPESYFPPPESKGGWRKLDAPEDIRRLGGMDPEKLAGLRWPAHRVRAEPRPRGDASDRLER